MRTYKTPINIPKTGHELVTCHYPLRIDTYSSCYHNCVYCYAKSMLSDLNLWTPDDIRVADLEEIKGNLERFLTNKVNGIVARAIQNRIPARLGGLTDCFQPIEKERKVTLQLLQYLNSIDYPYLIVTKSDLIAEPAYLRNIRKDLAFVQVTITTLDDKVSKILEPNAPLPNKRISALQSLINAGIFCAGRISPIIPNITDTSCFDVTDRLDGIGVPHIIFEFFRGNKRMIERVQKATGKHVLPLQKKGTYSRFPLQKKNEFYQTVAKRMKNSNTSFTFCSDGDPVPFSLHSTMNCCGADRIKTLVPSSKFNMGNEKVASNLYIELIKRKTVSLEDMRFYSSLADDVFCRFWDNGAFLDFVPNCRWDNETNSYRIE